jgi:serine/threonine protein kinase
VDFDQYKREVNNLMSAKETSMSIKNNLESRETAENKSQETQKTNRRLLNYEVGARLGKGSYATVHEAVDVNSNTRVAIKTYEKAKMNNKTRKTIIEREIQVLNLIDHPRMIKLHKVIQTKNHVRVADSDSHSDGSS